MKKKPTEKTKTASDFFPPAGFFGSKLSSLSFSPTSANHKSRRRGEVSHRQLATVTRPRMISRSKKRNDPLTVAGNDCDYSGVCCGERGGGALAARRAELGD